MVEEIQESVNVLASFSNGRLVPVLFIWRNRRYTDLALASTWSDYEGDAKRYYFSVLTGAENLYELCFNSRNLCWKLVRIYHE